MYVFIRWYFIIVARKRLHTVYTFYTLSLLKCYNLYVFDTFSEYRYLYIVDVSIQNDRTICVRLSPSFELKNREYIGWLEFMTHTDVWLFSFTNTKNK